jgi:hypothetical protein
LWYRIYRERFEPVLVEDADPGGALTGLMTLAVPAGNRQLVGAGAEQAEYQGWLSSVANGDTFFLRGLAALQAEFRGFTLGFPNLTPGAPLGWLRAGDLWRRATELRSDNRGLMPLGDGASLERSLRKKSNKSRLNRLERIGPVRLERVTSAAVLETMIDEIAALYDLRQGALNGITPFHSDPLKRRFHLELLTEGLLHATVLRVGDAIASAHLDLRNREQVLLCVIAHAPQFARHSPGKLHILLLGKELAREGVQAFDLSPGGEYKERFASTHEPVHSIRIHLGLVPAAIARSRQAARRVLQAAGVQPRQVRDLVNAVTGSSGRRRLRRRLASVMGGAKAEDAVLAYRRPSDLTEPESAPAASRDRLTDVVQFMAAGSPDRLESGEALRRSLDRLEKGDHVFTLRSEDTLLASGWMAHREGAIRLGGLDLEVTAPGPILYDLTSEGSPDTPDPRRTLLGTMLAAASVEASGKSLFAVVRKADASMQRALEALGFRKDPSLQSQVRPVRTGAENGGAARDQQDDPGGADGS